MPRNIRSTNKLTVLFTILIFTISLVGWNSVTFGSEQYAKVTGTYVNIRSGPSTNYAKIDLVYKDDKLTVLDSSNGWYKVKLSNGKVGWIAGWLVSVEKAVEPSGNKVEWKDFEKLGNVTGSVVNIRGGPSTGYSVLTQVTKGTQLGINEESKGWYNVTLANGSKGWIAGWLVQVSVNPNKSTDSDKPPGNSQEPNTEENSGIRRVAVVTGTIVNVRTGPSTGHSKITRVKKGESYLVVSEKDGWYKLQLASKKEGWIAGWLVQVAVSPSTPTPSRGDTETNPKPTTQQTAIVTGDIVNVRKGPSTSYAKITQVKQGESYTVLATKDGWHQLKLSNSQEGWIAGWLVQVNQAATTDPEKVEENNKIGVVTGTIVNIRKGPSTSYGKIDQVKKGDQLTILEEKEGWYKISNTRIKEGWIAGWLVNVETGERILQVSFVEKNGAPTLSLASNNALSYNDQEVAQTLEVTLDAEYKIEGIENLKLREPFKEVRTVASEKSKIIIEFTAQTIYKVVQSKDKKLVEIIIAGNQLKGKKIVLDPGHGGIDPGAVGPAGYREKDFNLGTTLKIKEILELFGAEVVLTRENDIKIPLITRSYKANLEKADIFVSIHANASTSSSVRGTKTYYYAPSSNSKLYSQLSNRKGLAELVQEEMVKGLGLKNLGIAQENFSVLRETDMPSALAEVAFISNSEEEKLLKTEDFQNKAAWSIANGVVRYFETP